MPLLINPLGIHSGVYVDKDHESKTKYLQGVYLHGHAQAQCPWDLCGVVDKEPEDIKPGVYECKILTIDEPATMYVWKSRSTGWLRGLIVLDSDAESIEYAKKCYDKQEENL